MEYRVRARKTSFWPVIPSCCCPAASFSCFWRGHASGREAQRGHGRLPLHGGLLQSSHRLCQMGGGVRGRVRLPRSFLRLCACGRCCLCGTLPDLLLFSQLLGGAFLCLLLMSCCGFFFFGSAFQNAALRHLFCALTLVCLAACVILPACVPAPFSGGICLALSLLLGRFHRLWRGCLSSWESPLFF